MEMLVCVCKRERDERGDELIEDMRLARVIVAVCVAVKTKLNVCIQFTRQNEHALRASD